MRSAEDPAGVLSFMYPCSCGGASHQPRPGTAALCRSARRRAAASWLVMRPSAEARPAARLRRGWPGSALAAVAAPWPPAVPWPPPRTAEAHAGALLRPGYRGALWKRPDWRGSALATAALCGSALAGVAAPWLPRRSVEVYAGVLLRVLCRP